MLTITYTLAFPGGQTLTARAASASPQARATVHYDGHLLPDLKPSGPLDVLDAYFSTLAEEHAATLTAAQTGEYDHWAE